MRPESKSLIVRGGDLARTLQELRSIHAGHLHVGNNDGKRTVNAKQCQAFFTAGGGGNIEFTSQHSPIGVQHRRFIVDKQYLLIHKFGPRTSIFKTPVQDFCSALDGATAQAVLRIPCERILLLCVLDYRVCCVREPG